MGEKISDERFEDILLQGLTDDYEFVKMTSFHSPNFGNNEIQSMTRNLYIDRLSRPGHVHKLAGRGAAMITTKGSREVRCTTANNSDTPSETAQQTARKSDLLHQNGARYTTLRHTTMPSATLRKGSTIRRTNHREKYKVLTQRLSRRRRKKKTTSGMPL